jgi:predicted neutral ceramidase superfamily lipid hydrolase
MPALPLRERFDFALRVAGALCLIVYGTVVAFVAVLLTFWNNKGIGTMWDNKGVLDWLLVAWLVLSSVVAFLAARSCGIDELDRPAFRMWASVTVLLNALPLIIVGVRDTFLIAAAPGILGIAGVVVWRMIHRNGYAAGI